MTEKKEIIKHIDHTLLSPTSTGEQITDICNEALKFGAASVCIPPSYVSLAYKLLGKRLPVCTVIGFPNGYNSTAVKVAEAVQAIKDGAEEIDMVINIAFFKDKKYEFTENEIAAVRKSTFGKTLKVIVETCYLTQDEKEIICDIVARSGADYIKTSTGFGTGNATFEDVALFSRCLKGSGTKIKASGGIKTFEDAAEYLKLGADRLGSSALIKSMIDDQPL